MITASRTRCIGWLERQLGRLDRWAWWSLDPEASTPPGGVSWSFERDRLLAIRRSLRREVARIEARDRAGIAGANEVYSIVPAATEALSVLQALDITADEPARWRGHVRAAHGVLVRHLSRLMQSEATGPSFEVVAAAGVARPGRTSDSGAGSPGSPGGTSWPGVAQLRCGQCGGEWSAACAPDVVGQPGTCVVVGHVVEVVCPLCGRYLEASLSAFGDPPEAHA